MLITVNKACYNHILNASVVSFIIYIDQWGITISSFSVYDEVIN